MRSFNLLRREVLAVVLATASLTLNAQTAMQRPLEEIGVIRSVSPATSTIVIGERKLKITTATKVTADERAFAFSPISSAWVGKQVAMETGTDSQGNNVILEMHIFGSGGGQ